MAVARSSGRVEGGENIIEKAAVDIYQVYYGGYAGTNLLITVLTASRIWWLTRGSLSSGTRRYRRIVAVILESGLLYPVSSFVVIGLSQSTSDIGTPIALGPTVCLIAGIGPALMIVRCRVFNALQNQSIREPGALSTLQFNSNVGTARTNPAQTDSQVRDVEAQSESSSSAADTPMGDGDAHNEEKGVNMCFSNSSRAL
ncbi:hypothetical protein PQX77_012267 [Marasmius sp. AFHP31]|nr:hypothetical protein PQX77_012267 [Marasmius sp. AFHP31]